MRMALFTARRSWSSKSPRRRGISTWGPSWPTTSMPASSSTSSRQSIPTRSSGSAWSKEFSCNCNSDVSRGAGGRARDAAAGNAGRSLVFRPFLSLRSHRGVRGDQSPRHDRDFTRADFFQLFRAGTETFLGSLQPESGQGRSLRRTTSRETINSAKKWTRLCVDQSPALCRSNSAPKQRGPGGRRRLLLAPCVAASGAFRRPIRSRAGPLALGDPL